MKIYAHINMERSPEEMSFQFVQQGKIKDKLKNDHSYQT